MYTEEQFFVYLQQFERDFAASRCRVIDATEGGARKQGVEVMTLRKAIDGFCGGSRKAEFRIQNQRIQNGGDRAWKDWGCDVVGNLLRVKGALEGRRESARGMKATCEATIPILREMIEHQQDGARMNRLFVEVDRLRGRVGEDPATFEMVTFLNTIGELRRYQADLLVKSSKKDPLDRQKRQLQRDVEYVGDLQVGAERLLEIIEEALGRLERQIAAARAEKAWPREVAGS
jgi:hypothetical protein